MAHKAGVAERPWLTQNSRCLRILAAYRYDGEESVRVRCSWTDPHEVLITGDTHCLRASAALLLVGFCQQGDSESLAKAIAPSREVVDLCQCPRDHPLATLL
jgi:hypothetical protein